MLGVEREISPQPTTYWTPFEFILPRDGDLITSLHWSGDNITKVEILNSGFPVWICEQSNLNEFPDVLNLLATNYDTRVHIDGQNVKLVVRYLSFKSLDLRRFLALNQPFIIAIEHF